jgi:hypothetical protein
MMCPEIDNPSSYEIRAVIRFLQSKTRVLRKSIVNYPRFTAKIRIMSEETVRHWYRMFKDGRKIFTMKTEVVGRPSIVSDDLVQSVDQRI